MNDGAVNQENTENENPAVEAEGLNLSQNAIYDMQSIIRKEPDSEQAVPLWLITFTDVMALMLTFFVLLYAMSTPKEAQWKEITASLGSQFDKEHSKPFHGGTQDTINIDRITTSRALNLKYLKTLVTEQIKQEGLKDVAVNQQPKSLVISLPSNILFSDGTAELTSDSKAAIYSLGRILSRIKNRIEIVGHTDPRPLTVKEDASYLSNWELSLARSAAVSALLKEAGYSKDIEVRGLSSARYDELPDTIMEEERLILARRVDIVIMQETLDPNKFLGIE